MNDDFLILNLYFTIPVTSLSTIVISLFLFIQGMPGIFSKGSAYTCPKRTGLKSPVPAAPEPFKYDILKP